MFFKTDYLLVNAGQKYSCILSTFIKLPVVIKTLFCLFLRGRFTQVLLYFFLSVKIANRDNPDQTASEQAV